jgi:hypothetical protein
MARQVAVKVQEPGAIGGNAPEQGNEQNIFQPWK